MSQAKGARHGWADAKDPADRRQEERQAITFKQLATEYMEKAEKGLILSKRSGRAKKPSTVAIDKYRIKHLKRHFGDKAVKNIDRTVRRVLRPKREEARHYPHPAASASACFSTRSTAAFCRSGG